MTTGSILLYHNGNQRVIDQFRACFRHHKFRGNWVDFIDRPENHCLYEICISDANDHNLAKSRELGVRIFRYISNYDDDLKNQVNELGVQSYQDWLSHVVCKNLCFSDIIVAKEISLDPETDQHSVIITTGRTANTHLQLVDTDARMIESSKYLDYKILKAKQAVLLWREDQWECLTSMWMMINSGKVVHQYSGKLNDTIDTCQDLSAEWIDRDWKNMCTMVLDHALFFHYVLKRHINHMTTEDVIGRLSSPSEKINYDKSKIIPNYGEMKNFYSNSRAKKTISMCYNNVLNHII